MDSTDRLLDSGQAAELMGVTPRTVRNYFAKGTLPVVEKPWGAHRTRRLVRESDVRKALEKK